MSNLGDDEDNPPLERPSYPGFSDPEEQTKPDLKSPLPQRTTLTPADAERMMVRKALEASAAATEAFTQLLPTLATKDDVSELRDLIGSISERVGSIDVGLKVCFDEISELRRDMRRGFDDVKTWLFDDERSIAQRVGLLSEQMDSVIPMAAAAKEAVHRIESVTTRTYDQVVHGPKVVTDDDKTTAAEAGE